MKGILIDPTTRTITECELQQKDLFQQFYELIGCDIVERFPLPYHQNPEARSMDDMWVNEMGWLVREPYPFNYGGMPFAGKVIILGSNRDGTKSKDTKLSLEQVKELVAWV